MFLSIIRTKKIRECQYLKHFLTTFILVAFKTATFWVKVTSFHLYYQSHQYNHQKALDYR